MKNRSPAAVFFLGLITGGIYSWYWAVKTKGEMNSLGEKVPTAWMWLIPVVGSLIWYWKYSQAVENVSSKQAGAVLTFILLILLGCIGQAVVQTYFNKISPAAAASGYVPSTPQQPVSVDAATPMQADTMAAPVSTAPTQDAMMADSPVMQQPTQPAILTQQPTPDMTIVPPAPDQTQPAPVEPLPLPPSPVDQSLPPSDPVEPQPPVQQPPVVSG